MQPRAGPRRGARTRRGIALATALVHAGLIAWAWRAAAPAPSPPRAPRATMQWVRLLPAAPVPRSAPAAHDAAAQARVARASAARVATRAGVRPSAQPTTASAAFEPTASPPAAAAPPSEQGATADPAVPTHEAVRGVAFAPPSIGGWGAGRLRAMNAAPSDVPPAAAAPAAYVAQMLQAQAAREAGRSQIAGELQRTLADALVVRPDGACALGDEPGARLACDNEALAQTFGPREAALAGLLRAYRSIEPRAKGLAIAVEQGRTQVSWTIDGRAR